MGRLNSEIVVDGRDMIQLAARGEFTYDEFDLVVDFLIRLREISEREHSQLQRS